MKSNFLRKISLRLKTGHANNRSKGVYGYMWWSAVKIILIYFITVIPLLLVAKYLLDVESIFSYITEKLPDPYVLLVFFTSESFLGMIPPDIFVFWAMKFSEPMFILILLGILSYIGGIISYYIGSKLSMNRRIKAYSEKALKKYINLVGKWGGAFIIIAALFPYSPYSMVVMAVSTLKYPFKPFLLFGITRVMRFILQGILFMQIFDI